jgi:hypothetical protein
MAVGSCVGNPSTNTLPAVGLSSPFRHRARVDLPEPFDPIIIVKFPSEIDRLTPFNTSGKSGE